MGWLITILITIVVMAISFYLISKLPIGVEIDSPEKALAAAVVFGILNAISQPLENLLNFTVIFSPVSLIINIIIFGLAAWLIDGFRLRNGIISAILGSIALTIVYSILRKILISTGLIALPKGAAILLPLFLSHTLG
ncbi:MAG: hypothetical protein B0A82_09110 [Alkalinema sp. CACIAM 70d]|nr:MAG: hypothetical protein B0A82_09110 [Alkalinema sp. CACIAM 70d]